MYRNIIYKFQSSTCKGVGEKLRTNCVHGRMDGQTEGQLWRFQYTPLPLRCGGYNDYHQSSERILAEPEIEPTSSCSQVPYSTE